MQSRKLSLLERRCANAVAGEKYDFQRQVNGVDYCTLHLPEERIERNCKYLGSLVYVEKVDGFKMPFFECFKDNYCVDLSLF